MSWCLSMFGCNRKPRCASDCAERPHDERGDLRKALREIASMADAARLSGNDNELRTLLTEIRDTARRAINPRTERATYRA
jgi:hypothetical protein